MFIYNPNTVSFEKDTLLSKFEHFDYNLINKTLIGYYNIRTDEKTRQSFYYRWSFAENKMVLFQEMVCYSKFSHSENYKCVVRKLIYGNWID